MTHQISKCRMSLATSSQSLEKNAYASTLPHYTQKCTYKRNLSCHLGAKVLLFTLVARINLACMGTFVGGKGLWGGASKNDPFPFPLLTTEDEFGACIVMGLGHLGAFFVSRLLKLNRKLQWKIVKGMIKFFPFLSKDQRTKKGLWWIFLDFFFHSFVCVRVSEILKVFL